jgi:hypothetical protein
LSQIGKKLNNFLNLKKYNKKINSTTQDETGKGTPVKKGVH